MDRYRFRAEAKGSYADESGRLRTIRGHSGSTGDYRGRIGFIRVPRLLWVGGMGATVGNHAPGSFSYELGLNDCQYYGPIFLVLQRGIVGPYEGWTGCVIVL